MPLHPKLRERIDHEASSFPDVTQLPVPEGRDVVRAIARETDRLAGPPPPLARVEDHAVPAGDRMVKVRLYFPLNATLPSPVLAYLHGGGWVFGDLETHDSLCREISARSGAVVAAVDYRRSPESKFPAALDDGRAVLRWLGDPATARRFGLRPDAIGVGGDSAGGTMATVLARQVAADGGPALVGQLLLCPVTDYLPDTPSYRANAVGYGLDASFMPWMWERYLSSPREGRDPRVAPLLAPDLRGLPPAFVVTAEYDILRDEGEQYADRLRAAGVPTWATRYDGMVHGFQDYRGIIAEGWKLLDEVAGRLREWFGSP